jgi:hypothetical protein
MGRRFYAGQYLPNTPEPDQPLCIAQTSLLFGITPMWSVAILMLMWNMNLAFCKTSGCSEPRNLLRLIVMLAAPYVTQLAFSTAALIVSQSLPSNDEAGK